MIDVILATDMAGHAGLCEKLSEALELRQKEQTEISRDLVLKMLIKTADLSNTVKPFDISRQWAICVTEEFFNQGDLEKAEGLEVLPMYDREKSTELAKGQLGFIDFVAKKHMTMMSQVHSGLEWLLENVTSNRDTWNSTVSPH
uniref:PDEase domain-containing protein n=1 Tax=Eutreptiella gymnastica TaxID=73025 RepID=A0A7S1IRD2_9EUGL